MATPTPARPARKNLTKEDRKVLGATLIGTTIEWYDFFIYAQAAGLIFGSLFLAPVEKGNPGLALILSFATVGISFLFRPLGAVVAGHLGDTIGRKRTLALTLIMMGASTLLIGLLPTYAQIGVAAPVLLIVLRVLQGFSAGGEWGGAVLLSVEHAPAERRGHFGAYPQIGVPAGMLLASAAMLASRAVMSEEAFMAWGWRLPFIFSIVLILVGVFVRKLVEESPVFVEMSEMQARESAPLGKTFRQHWRHLLQLAVVFAGCNATGYIVIAFFGSYAQKRLGLDGLHVTLVLVLIALIWIFTTLWGGDISDRLGRVRAHRLGYLLLAIALIPTFLLVDFSESAGILVFFLGILLMMPGQGIAYGPTSAMFAELFPADIRYSGISLAYAIGSVIGGAFATMIAQTLLEITGSALSIAGYLILMSLASFAAVSRLPEVAGRPLLGDGSEKSDSLRRG